MSTAPPSHQRAAKHDFRLLWWANAADGVGTQATGAVLPLLLLGLGNSPQVVGLVAGVSTAAGLVLGPLVAVPVDRGARRRVMLGSASVAATAMGCAALALTAARPPLGLVLAAVLVERVATACFEAASRGTVALVCPPPEQPRAVGRLAAADQGALIVGPVLGGVLYQASRALPFVLDALSYAVGALCVRAMRTDLGVPAPRERGKGLLREGAAGLALVRSSPLLRLVLVWTATVNLVVVTLYFGALFALQHGGHGGGVLGAVLAASGAAGLAGSLAAPRIARRWGVPRVVTGATWLLVPLTGALAAVTAGATGVGGAGAGPWADRWTLAWACGVLFCLVCLLTPPASVALQARAIQSTAPALQARTGAVLATATTGAAALAPVLAGVLAGRVATYAPAVLCGVTLALLALHTRRRTVRAALANGPAGPTASAEVPV
ncbi:MFS transporter [Streptomyces ficellus]|uniref:MFS transporter n=1 Tax=Streptomyces ficellus TaxID=1977088 RepID=UPI001FCB0528|nr:MFS transporter [Streptomyces ficellus]